MSPSFDEDPATLRRWLQQGVPAYLPVNPIEYHGPHLSLRNDHLVSVGLARDLHAALAPLHGDAPLLLARDLDIGVDPAPGPGSVAVPLAEVTQRVKDACRRLVDLGASRVVLMTFHGSPLHAMALEAGIRLLRRRGVRALSPLNLVLRSLLSLRPERYAAAYARIADPSLRRAMIEGLPQDFHGGFFETSVALHYAPETVLTIHRSLPPCPPFGASRATRFLSHVARLVGARQLADELTLVGEGLGWFGLRPFPGYTGSPHLASAEAGAVFAHALVDDYAAMARDVLYGDARSPKPILRWLPAATLGGRLGPQVPVA